MCEITDPYEESTITCSCKFNVTGPAIYVNQIYREHLELCADAYHQPVNHWTELFRTLILACAYVAIFVIVIFGLLG